MAEEKQNENIGHLGNTWLNEVKNIRAMAKQQEDPPKKSKETIASENVPQPPSDEELFAGPVIEEASPQQLFAGDEDFYKSLKSAQPGRISMPSPTEAIPILIERTKHFSLTQKGLAAAIFLIAAIMLYAFLIPQPAPVADQAPEPDSQVAVVPEPSVTETRIAQNIQPEPRQTKKPKPVLDTTEPVSLKIAQTYYLNEDYEQALLVYENLLQNLSENPKEDLMRDSLQLQTALCSMKTDDYIHADQTLRKLFNSKSPAVRVLANYHSCLREIEKKQYLDARTMAYRAISLIDAVDFDKNWSMSLKRNCYFLAGETVTKKILSLCDTDKDIPESLWADFGKFDEPFTNLNEAQLRHFLNSGTTQLNQTILSPTIQQLDQHQSQSQYRIICNGAPTEELLTRFAANSGMDIHWQLASNEIGIRKRQLYVYLFPATVQQFATIAGSAGLLAKINEENVVSISNPATYSYASEHIAQLSEEANSIWRKYLLWFPKDRRIANAHFALGLLHASNNRLNESIAEYKLITNHFSTSSLASYALLNSSDIKNTMHDYTGARMDLKQLVEQYPDTEISETAYMNLANNYAMANLNPEAIKFYRKAYYISTTPKMRSAAALEIGKCSCGMEDYESSKKWMERYFEIARDNKTKNVYEAYFILGKTYMAVNDEDAASEAFQYAIQGGPSQLGKKEYIDTISSIVETYIQQEHFVKAMDMLENIHTAVLTPAESTRILLLKSRTFRAIGLIDKAIALIGPRINYTEDTVLKTQLSVELSKCYIEKGSLELAQKKLADVVTLAESGPVTHEITYKLADVYMQMGRSKQALSVCSKLLALNPSDRIRQKTLDLMAIGYNNQKDYNKAALALLDSN
jgi:tetratricopeptide (TPR) repeat protein